jgi:hypothetical protein
MNNMKFDIQAILDKSDLLVYVERAGGEPKGGGNRYACACPIHGGDNPTAFSIYFQDGRWKWNCFTGSCGGGDAITFIQKWQGLDFVKSCEWINGGAIEDSQGMKESAEARLEAARLETIAAKEREEARRKELQVAEKHLLYHNNMLQTHKDEWTRAGIDEGMQDFWTLGGCENFEYWIKGDKSPHYSETLTIPIINPDMELMTIQHRLLSPANPKDKYRPDMIGLHSHPFLAVPSMGYDGGMIFVMEGAKKAMVTWTRSDSDWQCIGVPSQVEYKNLIEDLKPAGSRVVVVPDPNSERNPNAFRLGAELAKAIGGKVLHITDKIDDMILALDTQKDDLYAMAKQARRV